MKKNINSKDQKVKAIPCDVYSRVVGYYRPIQYWNEGKREEFKDRKYLKVEEE